ncbi:MAG: nucleotidyltransferase domain-containing protein [Tannerellaceae bacterium]|jgi:predicted nucleotidyltransferase|nr:nucleotidyltransferase domain-containing protein [Tannerellaceae bacterium]
MTEKEFKKNSISTYWIMDKNEAIRISKNYIHKVRQNGIPVLDCWLFGSYAKDTYHKDSDIFRT